MLGHTTACVISVNHWQPTAAAAAVGPWPVVPHSTLLVVLAQNKLVSFRAGKYRNKRERRGLDQSRPRNCSAGTTVFQSHRFVSSEVLMIDCEFGWHKVFQSHRHACLSFFRQSSLPGGYPTPPVSPLSKTPGGVLVSNQPPHHQTNHTTKQTTTNLTAHQTNKIRSCDDHKIRSCDDPVSTTCSCGLLGQRVLR